MARTSRADAAAVKLTLGHPAIKTASAITGMLLQHPDALRPQIMHIVEAQLVMTLALPLSTTPEPAAVAARARRRRAAAPARWQ